MNRELWELERDIELERAMLDLKLSQLSQNMSFKALAGDATDHVVGAGADAIAKFLGGNAAQNAAIAPLVSTLVAWATRPRKAPVQEVVKPASFTADASGFTADASGSATQQAASEPLSEIHKMAQEMRANIGFGTEELSDAARERVIAAREEAIAAAEEAAGIIEQAPRSAMDFVRENPVAVGAACLALGAVVAGAFLIRDREKTAAQERQKRFDQADQVFNHELERLREQARAQTGTQTRET